jgi:hypothetical protein
LRRLQASRQADVGVNPQTEQGCSDTSRLLTLETGQHRVGIRDLERVNLTLVFEAWLDEDFFSIKPSLTTIT